MLVILQKPLLYIHASNTQLPGRCSLPPCPLQSQPSAACCHRKLCACKPRTGLLSARQSRHPCPLPAACAGVRLRIQPAGGQNYQVSCANCSNTAAGSRKAVKSGEVSKHSRSPSSSHTNCLHKYNVVSGRTGTLNLPGPPPGSDAAAAALMETLQIKSRHCLWPGEQSWVAVLGQQGQRGSHVLQGGPA